MDAQKFVVATPTRSVCDDNARALEKEGALRFLALGTRHGTAGISKERTRLNLWIGLAGYVAARSMPQFQAERFRFGLLPWFDAWVQRQLLPGDHIISSYGYVNDSFRWIRKHGGKTFLDGGNSHPENYWELVGQEYARWGSRLDPMPRNWYERSLRTMPLVDYVLSPSSYVTNSFLAKGFDREQILENIYPVDLRLFAPHSRPRERDRPLTLISTGAPSLRKGTPYLLDAFRTIRKAHPNCRLLLNNSVHDSLRPILDRWSDLPIEWVPSLPHSGLATLLRSADIFVLPSLEEGLARTALEALGCGLPVIVTPHTGANDFVIAGENGDVVPIRDPEAIAAACLKWATHVIEKGFRGVSIKGLDVLSFEYFERRFLTQLRQIGIDIPCAQ